MKLILTLFISLLLTKGCSEYKELEKSKIVYEASSRGYFKMIIIENKTLLIQNVREGKAQEVKLTDLEWKKLATLFKKIDLSTYNTLEGPTQERYYDGKPHANLSFTKDKVDYVTLGFDHTIPPAQIKELVDAILKLSQNK
ncbi:hypothetical protein [uncultured Flavobacterium sp.]|uniref:hypothetical protein n=1 Tax=uncultured Flavobacterium sp. TaxID=165435 RepID=UPI0030CA3451